MVNKESNDIIQVQGINSQGYGIIPKLVMQDNRLSIQAKAIYGYFCSYAGAGRTAFPSRKKIVADLGISKTSYYKHFNLLKDCGYLEVTQEKDKNGFFDRNIYTLVESVPCPKIKDTVPCPKLPCPNLRYTVKQDTNNNSIKINSIYNNQSVSQDETDGRTIEELQSLIWENISYEDLKVAYEDDIDLIDEFISIILDTLLSDGKMVRISGENKPRGLATSNLMKLKQENIIYVLEQFKSHQTQIKKKAQYILTMLYHSVMELESHYTNLVQSDRVKDKG